MHAREKLKRLLDGSPQDRTALSVFVKLASHNRIGDILLRTGMATREQLVAALYAQSKEPDKKNRIGDILVRRKVISRAALEELAI